MNRDACPTGMMRELFVGDSPLEPKKVLRKLVVVKNVDGDGNCLFRSLLGLYNASLQLPLGDDLRRRTQDMLTAYKSTTPEQFSKLTPYHLRLICTKFLAANWTHYFNIAVFRERLVEVARKDTPRLTDSINNAVAIREAYTRRMTDRNANEWGGNLECDIASEIFGAKIEIWVERPNDPQYLWRNNVFEPTRTSPGMPILRWPLVHRGGVHFEYILPWLDAANQLPPPGFAPPEVAVTRPRRSPTKRVHFADQVDGFQANATSKIRNLIRTSARMTFPMFKDWFTAQFRSLDRTEYATVALHLFFAAYTYYLRNAGEEPESEPAYAPGRFGEIQVPPNMGSSVVDEVFAKHTRFTY